MENDLNEKVIKLQNEVEELRYIIGKKLGFGSADVKANIVSPSTVGVTVASGTVDQAAIVANAVGDSELKLETATVSISAGSPSGTAGVTSGNVILGWYPVTNLDQIIDDISISGTTLTVTLSGNATATTTIKVTMIQT